MNDIGFSICPVQKTYFGGYDLKSTDKRVVDISYQYGYDSPRLYKGVSAISWDDPKGGPKMEM